MGSPRVGHNWSDLACMQKHGGISIVWLLFRNKKEWSLDIHNNVEESQKNYADGEKHDPQSTNKWFSSLVVDHKGAQQNFWANSNVWYFICWFHGYVHVKIHQIVHIKHLQLIISQYTSRRPSMGFSRQEYWSGSPLPSPMTNLDSILKSRDITLWQKSIKLELWFFQ